jgi:hypothetical protein
MVAFVDAPGRWPPLIGAACAALAGVLALSGIVPLSFLSSARHQAGLGIVSYPAWCRQLEQAIPAGSTVLLDCIPAPNFGFTPGRNQLRFLRPGGFSVDPAAQRAALEAIGCVVAGRTIADPVLAAWVKARGRPVVELGTGEYYVRVIRLR